MNVRFQPLALPALVAPSPCSERSAPPPVVGPTPDSFHVALATSKGDVVVAVYKSWSPHGADRFYRLVSAGFFDDQRFFRAIPPYITQFGASAHPEKNPPRGGGKSP